MGLFKVCCGRRVAFGDGGFRGRRYTTIKGRPVILFYLNLPKRELTEDDIVEEGDEVIIDASSKREAIRFFNSLEETKRGVMWRRKDDKVIEIQNCEFRDAKKRCHHTFLGERCKLEKRKYCLL